MVDSRASVSSVHALFGVLAITMGTMGVSGCASTPPPDAEVKAAEVAVAEAREADAADHAPGPFILAQDKLKRAQEAFSKEDFVRARRLAEEAEIDAQFAEAKARSEVADARIEQLRDSIRILREEIARQ